MKTDSVPSETIRVFARSIFDEATRYGFRQVDVLRLINELMDLTSSDSGHVQEERSDGHADTEIISVDSFPLLSTRLAIRLVNVPEDLEKLNKWLSDEYGRHFVLSSASAQSTKIENLASKDRNRIGIIQLGKRPIGAVAYLDIDASQRRAELRKLIGERDARGKGFAEEATRLWIEYGFEKLGLEKIYVSTLQTHLRNIQLNESIGFRVEGLLHDEVRIGDQRFSVLRMGLIRQHFKAG